MPTIKAIHAYEIIDSKGLPTLEGRLVLSNDAVVTTSIPSSLLSDKKSVVDLKDEDPNRFNGMGVSHAATYINELIGPKIIGASVFKQSEIDQWLVEADGTSNKSKLGANTILIVSQLLAKAGALGQNVSVFKYINYLFNNQNSKTVSIDKIPTPIFNMINGGKHANNKLDFQEFEIIPSSSFTFGQAYQKGVETLYELKKVLEYRNATTAVGEEGGFSPNLTTNLDALEILNETIVQRHMRLGVDMFLGIDLAASSFYKNKQYFVKDKTRPLHKQEYFQYIKTILESYPLMVLEDPFAEEDSENWSDLVSKFPNTVYIVGDELIRMGRDRLDKALKLNAISSLLIKLHQIGTISETLKLIQIAQAHDISYIIASSSSETNDVFTADFAVGVQSEFVKFGATVRGERVSKYNRLWQIEREELNPPT